MNVGISRRRLLETAGIAALASPASAAAVRPAPRFEGKDTPKIALSTGDGGGSGVDSARRIKQLGVDWVLGGMGQIPWDETRLKEQMDRFKASGLTVGNLMIGGHSNAIYGRPGRD